MPGKLYVRILVNFISSAMPGNPTGDIFSSPGGAG